MKNRKCFRLLAFCAIVALGIGLAATADAQSGRQTTPDGKHVLVNRAESGLQWAISYSPNAGTITGNVFDPGGGDPSYIWCDRVGDDGVMDPAAVQIDWRCEGADQCTQSPCSASGWVDLGVVPLGGFFFLPAVDPFVTLQLPGTYCDPIRVGPVVEFGTIPSFEVDSSICRYASMTQTTLTPVEADDGIWARIWNYQLDEPEGGSVFVTLMIGDEIVYSEELEVPRESGLLGPRDANGDPIGLCLRPGAIPAGTLVSLNIQAREGDTGTQTTTGVNEGSDLASPQHSTPGVIHMLDLSVSTNCVSQESGRQLVNAERWDLVSRGLPLLP